MILKLTLTNLLSVPMRLRTDQPLELGPNEAVDMTFEVDPDEDGVVTLGLICEPVPSA